MIPRPRTCAHETDVLDLVAIGRWPPRGDDQLRRHVAECVTCREVARIAAAIADVADVSFASVRVPDASVVWHRAEARNRQERARRAVRPVTAVFVVMVLCVLATATAGWFLIRASVGAWWPAAPVDWLRSLPAGTASISSVLPGWRTGVLAAVVGWSAMLLVAVSLVRLADRDDQAPQR